MSPRRCLVAGLIAHAVVMFGVGGVLAQPDAAPTSPAGWWIWLVVLVPLILLRAQVLSRLPGLVRQAGWMLMRPLILWEVAG